METGEKNYTVRDYFTFWNNATTISRKKKIISKLLKPQTIRSTDLSWTDHVWEIWLF